MATFHRMQGDDGREVIRCFVKGALTSYWFAQI